MKILGIKRIDFMHYFVAILTSLLSILVVTKTTAAQHEVAMTFNGAADASAAVNIDANMFVVADDENNTLRIYKINGIRDVIQSPLCSFDMTYFLDVETDHPEADIEAATRIGNRIYWITSHGRNKDGKIRTSRYRFFATYLDIDNGNVQIKPIGIACKTLVQSLLKIERMHLLGLDNATKFDEKLSVDERKSLAPKKEGLNIEGLCASPDGTVLYIGFRNPRPLFSTDKKPHALVVPLVNAKAVVEKADKPVFNEPLLWDLAGHGIRSIEYSIFHKTHFIIAGPHDEKNDFALYQWSGNESLQPVYVRALNFNNKNFTPEAIVCYPDSPKLLILSDDGSLPIRVTSSSECKDSELDEDGMCPNKSLVNSDRKTFRVIWLEP